MIFFSFTKLLCPHKTTLHPHTMPPVIPDICNHIFTTSLEPFETANSHFIKNYILSIMNFETNAEFETTEKLEVAENARYCSERNCSGKPTRFGVIKLGQMSMVVCLCDKHAIMSDTRTALKNYGSMEIVDEHWDKKQKKFIVPCRKNGYGQVYFNCIWCGVEHTHGAQEGHRVAHCESEGSPYSEDGYYLVKESKDRPFVESAVL